VEAEVTERKQRRHGRLDGEGLQCNLGQVLNISAGGMVVTGRVQRENWAEIALGDEGCEITVIGHRVWSRRVNRRTEEVGYRFLEAPADLIERIKGVNLPGTYRRPV